MQTLPKTRLFRFVEQAMHLARRTVARYSSKFSKRRYTLHQHIALLCLKARKNTTSRMLLDELIEIPRLQRTLGLEELPSPSTLCKAFDRLDMTVWRVLLNPTVSRLPTNGVVRIDASGFDRSHALEALPKRTKLTIQQLNVTRLVDTRATANLNIHVTTTRKHDSKIAASRIKRNTDEVVTLLGVKGYDDQNIRTLARKEGVRPLIKHREFSSLHKAWNAQLDADLYGQCSQNKTVTSRLQRK